MNKTKRYIVTALLTTLSITGCGATTDSVYGDNTTTPDLVETSIYDTYLDLISPKAYNDTTGLNMDPGSTISIIALEKSSDYWNQVKAGAEKAIEDLNLDLGYTGKDAINLSYNTPSSTGNVEEMINILDSELSRYPAAIAIAISDPYAYGMQFDQAMDNGIPIVAFEAESYSTTLSATVATDYVAMAKDASSKTLEIMGDETGKVLVLSAETTSDSSSKKITTIKDTFKNSTNVTLLDIFDLTDLASIKMEMLSDRTWVHNNLSGDNNTIASNPNHELYGELVESINERQVLTHIISTNPGITNFISLDERCNTILIDSLNTLDSNYNDLNIISFSTSEDTVQLLDEGILDGVMAANPYGMGYATVVATIRAALHLGNEALINPGIMWQDNL